jgi:hypothetical protein
MSLEYVGRMYIFAILTDSSIDLDPAVASLAS